MASSNRASDAGGYKNCEARLQNVYKAHELIPSIELRRLYADLVWCWETICKTVRPMLLDRCLPCLFCSVLSAMPLTLVSCGQTVGRIKMPLGTEVGLGLDPGHIVLDWDQLPQAQQPPILGPCLLWRNGYSGSR